MKTRIASILYAFSSLTGCVTLQDDHGRTAPSELYTLAPDMQAATQEKFYQAFADNVCIAPHDTMAVFCEAYHHVTATGRFSYATDVSDNGKGHIQSRVMGAWRDPANRNDTLAITLYDDQIDFPQQWQERTIRIMLFDRTKHEAMMLEQTGSYDLQKQQPAGTTGPTLTTPPWP